jgi:hypothetical protein
MSTIALEFQEGVSDGIQDPKYQYMQFFFFSFDLATAGESRALRSGGSGQDGSQAMACLAASLGYLGGSLH